MALSSQEQGSDVIKHTVSRDGTFMQLPIFLHPLCQSATLHR